MNEMKPFVYPTFDVSWTEKLLLVLGPDSPYFEFTHWNDYAIQKLSTVTRKRWVEDLKSAVTAKEAGNFSECYHYTRHLLQTFDSYKRRPNFTFTEEELCLINETKSVHESILPMLMAADKIALTEAYDANKNLITHWDLIDWQKAIREAFYLNVFQSCVIEANISAMSFEEATDLLQNGKLNAAVIDNADAKKKEKEASVLAGLAKAYAFMLKALKSNPNRSMTIDLPYLNNLHQLCYGEIDSERAGASRHESLDNFVKGMEWLQQQDIDPISKGALLHYLEYYVHVFADGNRRVGRLLLNTILLQHGFPLVIIRDTDDKFERHGYMGAMFDGFTGDLRPFIGAINSHLIGTINIMRKHEHEHSPAGEIATSTGEDVDGNVKFNWISLFSHYIDLDRILEMKPPYIVDT